MKNKKKHIPGALIVLMAIALLGIIGVQFFWFSNALHIQDARFSQSVNQALRNVSKRLDKERHAYFISDKIKGRPTLAEDMDSGIKGRGKDSVVWKYDYHSDSNLKTVSYSFGTASHSKNLILDEDSLDEAIALNRFFGDTNQYSVIIKLDSLKNQIGIKNKMILSDIQDSLMVNIEQDINRFTISTEEVDKTIDEMLIELKAMNEPFGISYNQDEIREKVKHALLDQGIQLAFELSIIKPSPDSIDAHQSKSNEHFFQTRLFPDDLFTHSNILQIKFPTQSSYLLKSMRILLAASVIFTLIIIFTFFITVGIIWKQKKLAIIKADFINNMTHEFKTPIATISLAIDSITNSSVINSPKKIKSFAHVIREENNRMNANVENVLQMALIDKRDFNFVPEEVDIHQLIQSVAENSVLLLNKRNGKISFSLQAEKHVLFLDAGHMRNIVTNLVDNAIKYSTHSPEIHIHTHNTPDYFVVEVSDKGIGIRKEYQDKIFEKFFRVSSGDIHNVKGFGLGLSYVKALVLAWGGEMDVKSQLGKGSTFRIRLPINDKL